MMKGREVTIVLVDDDDGDAKAVRRAFTKAGIPNPIVRAVDGIEALEFLGGTNGRERLWPPYVLLVDINMPRMCDLSLIAALRGNAALKKTVAFVLTTSRHDADKCTAYGLNIAGYVVKNNAGIEFLDLAQLVGGFIRIVELP